jgi:hypothetical protein
LGSGIHNLINEVQRRTIKMAGGNLTPEIAGYFLSLLKTPIIEQKNIKRQRTKILGSYKFTLSVANEMLAAL